MSKPSHFVARILRLSIVIISLSTIISSQIAYGIDLSGTVFNETAKTTTSIELDLNGNESKLPKEIVQKLKKELLVRAQASALISTRYAVGDINREDNWGIGILFPVTVSKVKITDDDSVAQLQDDNSLTFVFVNRNQKWEVALPSSPNKYDLLDQIPNSKISKAAKNTLFEDRKIKLTAVNLSQKYLNYKFPYQAADGFTFFRYPSGWHSTGTRALDFANPNTVPIVASAPGLVYSVCKNANGKQAWIGIRTEDPDHPGSYLANEQLLYLHFDKNTIPANIVQGAKVTQGQILGVSVQSGDESGLACSMWSTGKHVHILLPFNPIKMDNYTFTSYTNGNLKILDANNNEVNWSGKVFHSTQGQGNTSGNLNITGYYGVTGNITVTGDITVNSGSELHIFEGGSLDFNFINRKVMVKAGGKIVIESGAKLF